MIHGSPAIWLRCLSGPDIDGLEITNGGVPLAIMDATLITEVRTDSREAFAARLRSVTGTAVRAVATADEAFEGAGILVEASRLEEPTPLTEETLYAEIGEIVSGRKPGRAHADERILFWHRGLSILDVALAHLVLTRAEAAEAGTMLRYR